jgi:cytochrome c oxidase subunit IV
MLSTSKHAPSALPYFLVFGGLLVLTLTTVLVASAPLGAWHTTVALAIAVIKASLIVLFFMHAVESSRLTWMVIVAAVLWLAIMMGGIFSDYLTRSFDEQHIRMQTSANFFSSEPVA